MQAIFFQIHLVFLKIAGCILLSIFFSTGFAQQEKRFLLYDSEDGLSNNNVHAITRSADGLVWLGTQDGLCSFDGKQFQVYKHNEADSNSISDQFILFIKEDKSGNIWVGTRSGLNYFDRKTRRFKRFYLDQAEKHVFQSSYDYILLQHDNKILVKNKSLVILDPRAADFQVLQPENKHVIDWLIMPDYSGWSFNKDRSVHYFPDTRKAGNRYAGTHTIPVNGTIGSMKHLQLNDSITYLYNFNQSDSIYVFNMRTQSIRQKIPVPPGSSDICVSSGELLLCNASGLYRMNLSNEKNWVPLNASAFNGLPSSGFLSAFTDKEGNTWLGSAGAGVAVNNPNLELFTIVPTLIPNERINCIRVSGRSLYAGTYSGLYRIRDIAAKNALQFEPVLTGKFVSAVTTDVQENIWAAVRNEGILILSPSGRVLRSLVLPDPAIRKTIFHLTTDKKGRILVSSSVGFFIADPANGLQLQSVDSTGPVKMVSKYFMSSFRDAQEQVWLAGYHGINILDEKMRPVKSFKSFRDDESFLQRTIVTSVTQDRQGVMWIATIRNGVYRYTGNYHTHYTHADGLPSDIAYNIICDNNNRIWVCTSAGLSVFDEKEKIFRSIPAFDGISKIAFSLGPVDRYNDKLIFGANGKLLMVDADRYVTRKQQLGAYISDVKINGQSVDITGNHLELMADNKLIQFDFAYSPAFHSGNIIYQYRIPGIDSNWTTLTPGASSISYTGLPYKKLLMQVRAAGAVSGLSRAPVYSLGIHSVPPFYKRIWFVSAAAIVLMAGGFFGWSLYNRRKYRRQLEALKVEKELHKERARIGRDLHDNIGAYTSALIAGLNRINPADEKQSGHIADLKEYGSSIMGLLRETIWMLNAEELTVTAFADRFINYAMRINNNYPEIDFVFSENISNDKKLQPAIMLNLFRILQEALQNACRHSGAKEIAVDIRSNEQLRFSIADNGRGFGGDSTGDHYGIDNMRQRAAEAGFQLLIESGEGAGTSVVLLHNTADAG